MRLHLILRPVRPQTVIPLNYVFYLQAAIHAFIERSSSVYSTFLHDRGFSIEGTSKKFKHYCFSQLDIPQRKIDGGMLTILSSHISWYIGMPVDETFKHVVIGLFERQEMYIGEEKNRFIIELVEIQAELVWSRTMQFRLLSPLTLSISEERHGRFLPQYLRPDDPRLASQLRENTLSKYRSLYGNEPYDTEFLCTLDEKFIADRGGYEKITKLITIKAGTKQETKVRGFLCPISITGNPELIQLSYESGLGEKGSMGFGMIGVK